MAHSGDEIPGHVFVVKADVTTIVCDAWLCPTDSSFKVNAGFSEPLGLSGGGRLKEYEWGDKLAIPASQAGLDKPLAVLGKVGQVTPATPAETESHIRKLLPVVGEFVEVAKKFRPETGQPLRLALPLIGTGHGGLSGAKGKTVKPLMTELDKYAKQGVDSILCTDNELAWSAVQSARKNWSWGLTPEEDQLAADLAEHARTGHLVLFIGAGVSRDAGLPGWGELLESLYSSSVAAVDAISEAERVKLASPRYRVRPELESGLFYPD
jgi:hypothetical protein